MTYDPRIGYRVSTPIYQNFSSNRALVTMTGSIKQDLPVNISKWVQVAANLVIFMQVPSTDQNTLGWIRENGKLKGTLIINSSYKNYAELLMPYDGFTESFEAFDIQGNPINGVTVFRAKQETTTNVFTTINVEIPIVNDGNIQIKLRLSCPFLNNSNIQKPEFLNLKENGTVLVYESTINVSEVIRNSDQPMGQQIPQLPWDVVFGMGLSAGIVITILKVKSNPTKKRIIDPEPSLL